MKNTNFPPELVKLRDQFLDYLKGLGRSKSRTDHITYSINSLYQFMCCNNLKDISNLTQKNIIQFQYYLYKEKRYAGHSIIYHLQNLDLFSRYLSHNNLIWKNPFCDIRYISLPQQQVGTVSGSNTLCAKSLPQQEMEIKRRYNFNELTSRWANWMKKKDYHVESVRIKLNSLEMFIPFLKERGIHTVYKIRPETIEEYKNYLTKYQYKPGLYYSPFMQVSHLRNICSFLLYLDRERLISADPAGAINLRRYYKELDIKYRLSAVINPKRAEPQIPNPEIQKLLDKFLQYTLSKGGSRNTIHGYIISVRKFYEFISARNIDDLRKVNKRDIMDFQVWLADINSAKAVKYSSNTVLVMLICLRSFFRYLVRYDYLVCDHTADIELPKHEDGIPHTCMDEREVKLLLNQPDLLDTIGLRDKAVLEALYSTGIRVNELVNLKINDVDFTEGLLRVDYPKGGKSYQRIIPIGAIACDYIKEYLAKARPLLDKTNPGPDGSFASYGTGGAGNKGCLFLSVFGRQMRGNCINTMVKKHLFHSGLRKNITTHSFRVTCATHMLKNDADIRYVQQQLGHRSIRTTQGYTRLVPKDLKAVHSRCHPRERHYMSG